MTLAVVSDSLLCVQEETFDWFRLQWLSNTWSRLCWRSIPGPGSYSRVISTARPRPVSSSSSVTDPSRRIMTTGSPAGRRSRSRWDWWTRSGWPVLVASRLSPTTSGASRAAWTIFLWSRMCCRWSRWFLCPVFRRSRPVWPCRASRTHQITSRWCVTSSGSETITKFSFHQKQKAF